MSVSFTVTLSAKSIAYLQTDSEVQRTLRGFLTEKKASEAHKAIYDVTQAVKVGAEALSFNFASKVESSAAPASTSKKSPVTVFKKALIEDDSSEYENGLVAIKFRDLMNKGSSHEFSTRDTINDVKSCYEECHGGIFDELHFIIEGEDADLTENGYETVADIEAAYGDGFESDIIILVQPKKVTARIKLIFRDAMGEEVEFFVNENVAIYDAVGKYEDMTGNDRYDLSFKYDGQKLDVSSWDSPKVTLAMLDLANGSVIDVAPAAAVAPVPDYIEVQFRSTDKVQWSFTVRSTGDATFSSVIDRAFADSLMWYNCDDFLFYFAGNQLNTKDARTLKQLNIKGSSVITFIELAPRKAIQLTFRDAMHKLHTIKTNDRVTLDETISEFASRTSYLDYNLTFTHGVRILRDEEGSIMLKLLGVNDGAIIDVAPRRPTRKAQTTTPYMQTPSVSPILQAQSVKSRSGSEVWDFSRWSVGSPTPMSSDGWGDHR